MTQNLRLITYNIRKGKGASGRRDGCVQPIGRALHALKPDLLLCQEVFHSDPAHAQLDRQQSQTLGDALALTPCYGPNRVRRRGEYGNATLSRLPVEYVQNHDVTTNMIEKRGVLYARLKMGDMPLHVFNAHLGLNQPQRLRQIRRIAAIIAETCGPLEPVLLAGDFNDWTRRIDQEVVGTMGFTNAMADVTGPESLTWHVRRPVFNLDRVYLRHLEVCGAERLAGAPWNELSDHFPLMAELAYRPHAS
jgi:endonuclease/exonuclease/phosphatase family metal-dependent hydrolase